MDSELLRAGREAVSMLGTEAVLSESVVAMLPGKVVSSVGIGRAEKEENPSSLVDVVAYVNAGKSEEDGASTLLAELATYVDVGEANEDDETSSLAEVVVGANIGGADEDG
jgi:hypothetical protein